MKLCDLLVPLASPVGSVLVPKVVIWEARNVVFGTLGDDFGDPGVSGDT